MTVGLPHSSLPADSVDAHSAAELRNITDLAAVNILDHS